MSGVLWILLAVPVAAQSAGDTPSDAPGTESSAAAPSNLKEGMDSGGAESGGADPGVSDSGAAASTSTVVAASTAAAAAKPPLTERTIRRSTAAANQFLVMFSPKEWTVSPRSSKSFFPGAKHPPQRLAWGPVAAKRSRFR